MKPTTYSKLSKLVVLHTHANKNGGSFGENEQPSIHFCPILAQFIQKTGQKRVKKVLNKTKKKVFFSKNKMVFRQSKKVYFSEK